VGRAIYLIRQGENMAADPSGSAGAGQEWRTPLGIPARIQACLFDMDGVLTSTASVHARAWKEMFDGYLRLRSDRTGEPFVPFDPVTDYDDYVDGKPRADGTRSFLRQRGISLPEGHPGDPPGTETVQGLGNGKNQIVQRLLAEGGISAYPGSVAYLRRVREAGLRCAVVSASVNTHAVLAAANLASFPEVVIDGVVTERERLAGKPAPDAYLAAARALGTGAALAAVFEDALAGVTAGRAGGFGYVVGVDRVGQAQALYAHGADVVVKDLADLLGNS
jgi:beta-phosphoglucomutase family hydrolase